MVRKTEELMKLIEEIMISAEDINAIHEEVEINEVKKIGNSGHVIVPRKWIGNRAIVIKLPKKELDKKISN